MSGRKKSFLAGAAILGVAGLICKLIGAVYRIPLSNYILLDTGMALYQIAYPVYTTLLVVSSAGLPTAVSRMVSERMMQQRGGDAYRVYQVAMKVLLGIGLVTTLIMALFSRQIASALGNENAAPGFLAIAPALLLVSAISAYRGFFQGQQNMIPTAVSQLIEQIFKLGIGFPLAWYMMRFGPAYGAAGALLGVSASELMSLLYLMFSKRRWHRAIRRMVKAQPPREPSRVILRKLINIAIPITIGASIMPLVGLADTAIVINRLQTIGFSEHEATVAYGLLTGNVNTIVNMPQVLTVALSMSLVPAITSSLAGRDYRAMRRTVQQGMKLAWMIGLPCFAGLLLLGKPIMMLLYSNYSAENLETMGRLLSTMSVAILFLSVVQTTTGILQGLARPTVPLISLAIGALLKIVLNYVLIGIPSINVYGAPIGTIACYATAAILNTWMVCYISRSRFNFSRIIGRSLLAAIAMAAVIMLMQYIGKTVTSRLYTLVMVAIGAGAYCVMLLITGAVTKSDMRLIPGGGKVTQLMIKLKLWNP